MANARPKVRRSPFIQQNPNHSRYSRRLSKEQWDELKPVIVDCLEQGATVADILRNLISNNVRITRSQLDTQLKKWESQKFAADAIQETSYVPKFTFSPILNDYMVSTEAIAESPTRIDGNASKTTFRTHGHSQLMEDKMEPTRVIGERLRECFQEDIKASDNGCIVIEKTRVEPNAWILRSDGLDCASTADGGEIWQYVASEDHLTQWQTQKSYDFGGTLHTNSLHEPANVLRLIHVQLGPLHKDPFRRNSGYNDWELAQIPAGHPLPAHFLERPVDHQPPLQSPVGGAIQIVQSKVRSDTNQATRMSRLHARSARLAQLQDQENIDVQGSPTYEELIESIGTRERPGIGTEALEAQHRSASGHADAVTTSLIGLPLADSCTSSMSSGFRSFKGMSIRLRSTIATPALSIPSISSGHMSWGFNNVTGLPVGSSPRNTTANDVTMDEADDDTVQNEEQIGAGVVTSDVLKPKPLSDNVIECVPDAMLQRAMRERAAQVYERQLKNMRLRDIGDYYPNSIAADRYWRDRMLARKGTLRRAS